MGAFLVHCGLGHGDAGPSVLAAEILQMDVGGILGNSPGNSTVTAVVFLTAILSRLQEVRWYFFATWRIHPVLGLSSWAFAWQVWLCPGYNHHSLLRLLVQSSDWNAAEGGPGPHLLPVKDNENLLDWATSSHCPQDTTNTHFAIRASLATSTIMSRSCWQCAYMGQLWSVASFYSRQSARENKVSAHCQHSTGPWQSISPLPDRNVFQLHFLWQQLRNRYQM